jgi:ABC-type spermidine/putrescine transport system permease subunit II
MIKFGVTPEINALSTVMLGVTLLMVLFLFNPTKKNSTFG